MGWVLRFWGLYTLRLSGLEWGSDPISVDGLKSNLKWVSGPGLDPNLGLGITLHTFDYVCFVHLLSFERSKLSARSARCAFLGYVSHKKGFLCDDSQVNHIRISRNVVFFEYQHFFP